MSDQKEADGAEALSEEDLWKQAEAAETAALKPAEVPEEPEPAAEPAAEDEAPEDPWARAPEDLRKQYEDVDRERRELLQYRKSNDGRVAALQREINKLKEAPPKAAEPQPPEEKAEDPLALLERLKEDYPEIGQTIAPAILHLSEQLKTAEEKDAARYARLQEQYLADAHPDWAEVTSGNADAFVAWVDQQSENRRRQIEENAKAIMDGRVAASIISDFKAHLKTLEPEPAKPAPPKPSQSDKRARQLQGAVSARPTGQPRFRPGVPEEGDPQDIWAAIEAEERARTASA